ncbi:arylesterase [Fulvivirgaceae bacterium PWU5]|uniref:Arylesterase n=1 Tax=Dawidia cretensis TaxID=2782350 RepID=A0AAP2DWX7_9BACT|nr:arylesterase [Dawidia cretensis]MBT1707874.1 arylesterase [Dawidia cretensis]
MRRIVFFGDSLTAGHGLQNPSVESYPALIKDKLQQENLLYEVINAGMSGDTSSGGLSRLDYWISQPVDVFILELGINDILRGLPLSSIHRNLDTLLQKVRRKYPQCKIIVMGMEVPGYANVARLEEFTSIYRRLAEAHNATLVPFFLEGVAGIKQMNLNDGLHPSKKGYDVIATKVWPVIRGVLETA